MAHPSTSAPVAAAPDKVSKTLLSVCSVTKQFGKTMVLHELSLDIAACNKGEIWMSGERLDVLPSY